MILTNAAQELRALPADSHSSTRTEFHVNVSVDISGSIEDHPLEAVQGISRGIASLDGPLRRAVWEARRKGFTWDEIGHALGVTRQSAWERFRDAAGPDEIRQS